MLMKNVLSHGTLSHTLIWITYTALQFYIFDCKLSSFQPTSKKEDLN